MKSYVKFLSRNIGYTLINVLGFAVSMAFVIITGAYAWQETHVDTDHSNSKRIWMQAIEWTDGRDLSLGFNREAAKRISSRFPYIEKTCGVVRSQDDFMTPEGRIVHSDFLLVDSTFYDLFDFELIRGDRATALRSPDGIVITEQFARECFGDADPMGRKLKLTDNQSQSLTVTGIMKPMTGTMMRSPDRKPINLLGNSALLRYYNLSLLEDLGNATGASVFLLTREGTEISEAKKQIEKAYSEFFWPFMPDETGEVMGELKIVPLDEAYLTRADHVPNLVSGDRILVNILLAASVTLLLFAVMNYVNLTVAQAPFRSKEMAVRRLLGSRRSGIFTRMCAESCVLVTLSMLLGIILAILLMPSAENLLSIPIDMAQAVNPTTVGILCAVLILTALISGVLPAAMISSVKPIEVVRGTFRRQSKMWWSKLFIVIQNVVAVVMISCGLTVYLQTRHLIQAPLGFETDHIIFLSGLGQLNDPMEREIRKLSCVVSVSRACGTPIDGGNNLTFDFNGKTFSTQQFIVDKNWFDIWGIRKESDFRSDGVYIDRGYMRDIGADENSIAGMMINAFGEPRPVRGIISDIHLRNALERYHQICVLEQNEVEKPWSLTIRVRGDEAEAWRQICGVYNNLVGDDLTKFVSTPFVDQMIEKQFEQERTISGILAVFALLTVIVSTLGLVGMSTYFVNQKVNEIAIRKVHGDTRAGVLRRLLLQFETYVLIAVIAGVPIAWRIMSEWLANYSYRIPMHWWIFAIAASVCLLTSLVAVIIQVWRAASVNPAQHLGRNQ